MYQQRFVVVIPTYDRVKVLAGCLNALENQQTLPHEIVVVIRNTDEVTKNFVSEYCGRNSRVKISFLQTNEPGYLPPIKTALTAVAGDFVALLDDDVIVEPDWVANVIDSFYTGGPNLGAITGASICKNDDRGSVYPARLFWFGRFARIGMNSDINNINAFCEGNLVMRGEAWNELVVDLRLNKGRVAHHGLDFALQLMTKRWKIKYEPKINATHLAVQGPSDISIPENITTYIHNLMLIIGKNFGKTRLVIFVLYNALVGQRNMPGLISLMRSRELRPKYFGVAAEAYFNGLVKKI